jgi:molecular chaperone GrpE (heat shock protein)
MEAQNNMQELKVEIAKIGAQMNETNRRLENIERNQERAIETVNAANIKVSELVNTVDDHDRRIGSIESNLTWTVKIICGVVLLGVLGLVIKTQGGIHFPPFL